MFYIRFHGRIVSVRRQIEDAHDTMCRFGIGASLESRDGTLLAWAVPFAWNSLRGLAMPGGFGGGTVSPHWGSE